MDFNEINYFKIEETGKILPTTDCIFAITGRLVKVEEKNLQIETRQGDKVSLDVKESFLYTIIREFVSSKNLIKLYDSLTDAYAPIVKMNMLNDTLDSMIDKGVLYALSGDIDDISDIIKFMSPLYAEISPKYALLEEEIDEITKESKDEQGKFVGIKESFEYLNLSSDQRLILCMLSLYKNLCIGDILKAIVFKDDEKTSPTEYDTLINKLVSHPEVYHYAEQIRTLHDMDIIDLFT